MMRARTARCAATLLVGCLGTGVALTPDAEAAQVEPEEHCVIVVVDQEPDGELITTEPECSASRPVALQRARSASGRASTFVIGAHYDGFAYGGSSLSVLGDDCLGGWLNVPAGWNNRISSTSHGCPQIRHFDGYYLVTPEQTTFPPGANLILLNNRTSSIQYLS